MTKATMTEQVFDQLFIKARTANGFIDKPVADDLLKQIYEVMKFGPTGANTLPMRIVFLKTPEAKARLKPFLDPGNLDKTMQAPVTALIAYDTKFYDYLPKLFPHADARSWFVGNDALIEETGFRNSALQGAYFMIMARAFGLDCGPMNGFDTEKVNKEFFPDGRYKANFLCNLGYADHAKQFPRNPRLTFEETCQII